MLSWLHISDIHFRPRSDWRDVPGRAALLGYLKRAFEEGRLRRPELIFCTGDIAFGAASRDALATQYTAAAAFFDELRGVCRLARERLFAVPGNHDVARFEINRLEQERLVDMAGAADRTLAAHAARINDEMASGELSRVLERLAGYGEFVREHLPHQADPEGRHHFARVVDVAGMAVGIAGFNSAWSCAGPEDERRLWMAAQWQFNQAREPLANASIRLGLMHHPVDWLNAEERRVARLRIAGQFDFWLHGHAHDAWVEPSQSCATIAAGAVNADVDEEFGVNLVTLDPQAKRCQAQLLKYALYDGAWMNSVVANHAPDGVWNFDFSARLKLAMPSGRTHVVKVPAKRGKPGLSFDRPGSIHLHVDGSQAKDFVESLVVRHQKARLPSELSAVDDFAPGPQRGKKPQVYKHHTPVIDRQEALDFFSTTLLHDGPELPRAGKWQQIASVVDEALGQLHWLKVDGVVVELERVVATVDGDGSVRVVDDGATSATEPPPGCALPSVPRGQIRSMLDGIAFDPDSGSADSAMYELHFALDISRDTRASPPHPPFDLATLVELTTACGIDVGGWFLFGDDERWAYRSNSFEADLDTAKMTALWTRLREALAARVDFSSQGNRLRLLAEEALAVWHLPSGRKFAELRTVPELAHWERKFEKLEEFWVAAPNFLGDQDDAFTQAMLRNFERDVRYVYFLRSDVDIKRWLSFKQKLTVELRKTPPMSAYLVDFRAPDRWQNSIAFVANPRSDSAEGVKLDLAPISRRIRHGRQMSHAALKSFVESLWPPLQGCEVTRWQSISDEEPTQSLATACLNFAAPVYGHDLDELDAKLSLEASTHDGEIIHYGSKVFLVGFRQEPGAIARAMQFAANMDRFGAHGLWRGPRFRIAVNHGTATRIHRAGGLRWEGQAIEGCRSLLKQRGEPLGLFLTAAAHRACTAVDAWAGLEAHPLMDGAAADMQVYAMKRRP